jgi:hypothetical protein
MEFDKDKAFGYPVLRPMFEGENPNQLDYMRSTFELDITPELDIETPEILNLNYQLDYSVREFESYIINGSLGIYLDCHCKKTYYSEKFKVDKSGLLKIDLLNLRDLVSISPFILAEKDFYLESERIHPDFGFSKFLVKKNSVVAWCPPSTFSVEKELFRSVRSIIDYQASDLPFGEYVIDADSDYVIILASEEFIKNCRNAENVRASQILLIGIFFSSVLAELLLLMVEREEEFSDKRWFQIIKGKCDELNLNTENTTDIFKNAQLILKSPLAEVAKSEFLLNE